MSEGEHVDKPVATEQSFDTAELTSDTPVDEILNMSTQDGKIDELSYYSMFGGEIPTERILKAGTQVKIIKYQHIPGPDAKPQAFVAPDKWQTAKSGKNVLVVKVNLSQLSNLQAIDRQDE